MIKISKETKNAYKNKNILVTGGTGSIGLALVKQLISCKPKSIKVLTNDENSVFDSGKIIGENKLIKYIIGDIRDKERCQLALRNVNIVFHAAAMKHIDICEENPFDAVKTNVIGTSNMLEASILEGVFAFIFGFVNFKYVSYNYFLCLIFLTFNDFFFSTNHKDFGVLYFFERHIDPSGITAKTVDCALIFRKPSKLNRFLYPHSTLQVLESMFSVLQTL